MMIDTRSVVRKARIPAVLVVALATALPGSAGIAGDKQKAQKAIDQLAMRMQSNGSLFYSDLACDPKNYVKGDAPSGGEIASMAELKRLLMSGKYETRLCVISGSQQDRVSEIYRKARVRYFRLGTNATAVIGISANYAYGSSWNVIGTKGDYDVVQKNFDPKKTRQVSSSYPGTSSAYLLLKPLEPTVEYYDEAHIKRRSGGFYTLEEKTSNCGNNFRNGGVGEYFAPCLILYPQELDHFITNMTNSAAYKLRSQDVHDVTFRKPEP